MQSNNMRSRSSYNKIQLLKYASFITRKMEENQTLSTLITDRTTSRSNLVRMIETESFEPALLLSLQLLSDVIVHCGDYLPGGSDITPISTRTFSLNTEGEYTTADSNNLVRD